MLLVERAVGVSQRPDGLIAPPAAVCGTESSVARRRAYGSGVPLLAGFGAFALLDGPGLTQLRAFWVSRLKTYTVYGLEIKGQGFKHVGF